jgi:hypothetical protein
VMVLTIGDRPRRLSRARPRRPNACWDGSCRVGAAVAEARVEGGFGAAAAVGERNRRKRRTQLARPGPEPYGQVTSGRGWAGTRTKPGE